MNVQKAKKSTSAQSGARIQVLTDKQLKGIAPKRRVSPVGFSMWVRKLMINWRQGTVASKGRSDVNFSNKKPWKQKGTGRARAGSARSPLWRGGGTIFGPQPRVRTLRIPRKVKHGVLNNLLWQYIDNGNICSLDWQLQGEVPKTSQAYAVLKEVGLHDKKINLFLSTVDALHYSSFANVPNVKIIFFDQSNAYDLAAADKWVVLNKDLDAFNEMVCAWM